MTRRKRVLLAMITVGQGHRTAAEALAAWFERLHPQRFECAVEDFTRAVGDARLDARHKASWRWMLRFPRSAYWGQRALDELVPVRLSRGVQGRLLAGHARRAAAYLRGHPVDLVVATHFFTVQALALAKRDHGLRTPVVGVNPDALDAHVLWAEPGVEELVAFSEGAEADLRRHGVPAGRVTRLPYLMRPEFDGPCEPGPARAALALPEERLVVLAAAGGEGLGGPVHATARALVARDVPCEYVALCGRNERLRRRLEALDAGGATRVRPLGFRRDVRRWVCAADVVVGKAGPATTFEAVSSGRPVVHTGYAAANEKVVLDWARAQGVGCYLPRPGALADRLEAWSRGDPELSRLQARARAVAPRNGGPELVRHLVERYLS